MLQHVAHLGVFGPWQTGYRLVKVSIRSLAAQQRPSIGSRSRFIVNSMFCDCRWRQLSTSVWYRSFGKRWNRGDRPPAGEVALRAWRKSARAITGEIQRILCIKFEQLGVDAGLVFDGQARMQG